MRQSQFFRNSAGSPEGDAALASAPADRGAKLDRLLEAGGLSQKGLAEVLGVDPHGSGSRARAAGACRWKSACGWPGCWA